MKDGQLMISYVRDYTGVGFEELELTLKDADGNFIVKMIIDPGHFLPGLMNGRLIDSSFTQNPEEAS